MEIDITHLRHDLKDYYGTAMFNASPMAIMELSKIEKVSEQKIIEIALEKGFDLGKYIL